MSASARGAGAHTCRTITAFFPACLPCSITTTLPDFKLRGNRAMVRARRTQPPARGARHGAGASARGRASQPGVWAGRLAVGGQGGRAGGSLEQVGRRVTRTNASTSRPSSGSRRRCPKGGGLPIVLPDSARKQPSEIDT